MDNEDTTKVFEVSEEEIEKLDDTDIFAEDFVPQKKSLKEKWNGLSKKKKVLIIAVGIIVLIAIVVGVLILTKKKEEKAPQKEEIVIVENQNYRYENGVLKFLDQDKKEIGEYKCNNKNEKKCYLAYFDVDEDVDNTKYIHDDESSVSFQTPIIDGKYVFVYDNPKETDIVVSLYNFKEDKIEDNYTIIKKGVDDYSFILKDNTGNFGLLYVKDGIKKQIDFKYDYLGYYDGYKNSKKYIALKDNRYFVIDDSGKDLSIGLSDPIVGFNDKYIKTKSGERYTIYDYQGNKITNSMYDYVTFADNYIVVVSNKMLYVLDDKGTKLNMDGYKLFNDYYNRTYFYDKDNKFVEIKSSFEVTSSSNTINIVVYDEDEKTDYSINAIEALVNASIENISYINGKLYFYSDKEKDSLIGTYTCKNKNAITSKESTLDNCFLAKVGSNYTPIINGRYVFINDTLSKTNPAIVLYDLQQNKELANYLKIDTGINSENRLYDADSSTIIALSSRSNKYGMITIGRSNVTKPLEFEFESVRRWASNQVLVKKSNGTYSIYNYNGEPITGEFGYEITHFDSAKRLVEVKNNKKIKLFNIEGDAISDKWYEVISTDSDDYILGFNKQKMDIMNYDGTKYCDKCLDIDLFTNDYNKGYKIEDDKVIIYNGESIVEEILFEGE